MTTDPPPALLLTVEEAAAQLGIARCRVFGLISSGELRSKKIGRSRRIPYDVLAEYVKTLPDEPAQEKGGRAPAQENAAPRTPPGGYQ